MFKSDTLKITFTYVGALVGAGFATGQEIIQFFTMFESKGLLGVLFSTLCIVVFGIMYLYVTFNEEVDTYYDLLLIIAGQKVAKIFDIIISLFLFGGFTIMIAAGNGLLYENIGTNNYINYSLIALILYLSFSSGIKGILKLNTVLIPLLVIVIVIICLNSMIISEKAFTGGIMPKNYLVSGLTYASYNLIIGMVVLSSIKKEIYNKSTIIFGPLYAGLLLGAMLILITIATRGLESYSEIPILDLARPLGQKFYYLLVPSIGIAILTSAIASGHGLVVRLQQLTNLKYNTLVAIIIIIAIPMSSIGFTQLIKFVYPFFGFINFLIMFLTGVYFIKKNVISFNVR
ncbi:hypothetical protein HYG86_09685 [Alkalicella caledoniensis]|uniref:Membrane protein YkvI n=1 Tax=Alkalicella caledoniensis TaxID=2731377 RepID=A0A7G9W8K7_ALKCA|nr:hypothetical protein [Alkalicella caledoniensis]QNO15019.1 hypothetical protein HYG86_09685 [Alkalicella caledoniensis]